MFYFFRKTIKHGNSYLLLQHFKALSQCNFGKKYETYCLPYSYFTHFSTFDFLIILIHLSFNLFIDFSALFSFVLICDCF